MKITSNTARADSHGAARSIQAWPRPVGSRSGDADEVAAASAHPLAAPGSKATMGPSSVVIGARHLQHASQMAFILAQDLVEQPAAEFFPQCIPFYAATEAFNYFRTQYPDYAYKEAALNPMNRRDRTIEWEADIVSLFIKAPAKTEFFGRRETPFGTSLYYSAPIRVDNESCLACHGTSDKAPPEMVKLYGTANGFGWKLHDVIGAQIVSVPSNLPDRAADDALKRTLWWLVAIFGALFLLVNLAFYLFGLRFVTPSQLPGLANKGQAS